MKLGKWLRLAVVARRYEQWRKEGEAYLEHWTTHRNPRSAGKHSPLSDRRGGGPLRMCWRRAATPEWNHGREE